LKAASTLSNGGRPQPADDGTHTAASMSPPRGGTSSHPTQNASGSAAGSNMTSDGGHSQPTADSSSPSGASGAAGAAVLPPAACKGTVTPSTRRELDLYLMVDNLITIPPNAWANLVRGLKRYVDDPRANGTGLGVGFLGFVCDEAMYTKPTVGIALLPGNRTRINAAIDTAIPFNLSPLEAAIKGSTTYARSVARAFQQRQIALVLITDSISDAIGCGDASSLIADAQAAFNGSPSVPIYVLAIVDQATFQLAITIPLIPNPVVSSSPIGPLNMIAAGGGTDKAYPYEPLTEPTSTTAASPFADTMVKIQHDAEPCDYSVPDGVPDNSAGAWLIVGSGGKRLQYLQSDSNCGDGYTFTTTPDGTRWAHLCDSTCKDVKAAGTAPSWVSGCPQ
jgi:hypothetical protein